EQRSGAALRRQGGSRNRPGATLRDIGVVARVEITRRFGRGLVEQDDRARCDVRIDGDRQRRVTRAENAGEGTAQQVWGRSWMTVRLAGAAVPADRRRDDRRKDQRHRRRDGGGDKDRTRGGDVALVG